MPNIVQITRKIEFDAGHRIPDHKSKCFNMHGHRYVLEATLEGEVSEEAGAADRGMVQDFGDLKAIMMEAVGEPWDHAFLAFREDAPLLQALGLFEQYAARRHKTVLLDCVPTVENLARLAFNLLRVELGKGSFKLIAVRLYETPNCWADYRGWRAP